MLKVLEDLYALDQELTALNYIKGITKTYKTMKLWVIFAATITTILVMAVMILEEITYFSARAAIALEIGVFVTYCLPLMCTTAMLFQFCTFLAIIKQRYSWLNQKIVNITTLCSKRTLYYKKSRMKISNSQLHL